MDFELRNTQNMEKYILGLADAIQNLGTDPYILHDIGDEIADYIKFFVPKKSGDLREAYNVIVEPPDIIITWAGGSELPYTRYQYAGIIYSPNIAVFSGTNHVGWVSPSGKPKHPKTTPPFFMGEKRTITLKDGRVIQINGYSEPGTGFAWITRFEQSSLYSEMRTEIGRALYEAYSTEIGKKPAGGYRSHFGWVRYG